MLKIRKEKLFQNSLKSFAPKRQLDTWMYMTSW